MSSGTPNKPLRIKLEREIGRGAHSRVKLGRDLDTFEPLAVKIVDTNESGKEVFRTELSLLHLVPEHRCIPKLYGHYTTSSKGCLVLEYLPFPTLKDYLADGPMSEEQAIHVLRQLVDVVHYMTGRGVAHRDLKADNIIVNPDTLQIKLIDFGLGTEISGEDARDSSYRGTPVYMAPEVLREQPNYRVVAAELWSVGVVFWECLLGAQPFDGCKSKRELQAKQTKTKELLGGLPEKCQELINGLLVVRPQDRLSVNGLQETIDELYPPTKSSSPRPSSERFYAVSRAKTFTDLRDHFSTSAGVIPASARTPRCPLTNSSGARSLSNSPSRHR